MHQAIIPLLSANVENCNMWLCVEHSPENFGRMTSHKEDNVKDLLKNCKNGNFGAQENTSLCIGLKYARYVDNFDRPFPKSIVRMGLLWPARA